MNEHPNAHRIRELFADFGTGDIAAIGAVIPERAVWHFPGRQSKLAGEHRGREAIVSFLLDVQALTNGTFRADLIDVLANDTNAVVIFRGHGQRKGRTLDNHTCLRMRLDGGQVVEVWEFVWDLYAVDEFWA